MATRKAGSFLPPIVDYKGNRFFLDRGPIPQAHPKNQMGANYLFDLNLLFRSNRKIPAEKSEELLDSPD